MFVVGNLFIALAHVLHALFQIAWWVLLIRIIASWVNPSPPPGLARTALVTIYNLTDPILMRVQRALPFLRTNGLDLSPIVLFLGLSFLDSFLPPTLYQLGQSLS
jgi:YggT family protein